MSDIKNPNLYRAQLACKVGRDALEGKTIPPHGTSPVEWAIYNLLHAIEDIAKEMEAQSSKEGGEG